MTFARRVVTLPTARFVAGIAALAMLIAFSPVVHAQSVGAIVGIVVDSARQPVAHATVTARKVDGGALRATLSNTEGIYSFSDLAPGAWVVSVQAGTASIQTPTLAVIADQATRFDIVMNAAPAAAPGVAAVAPPAVAAPAVVIPKVADALQAPAPGLRGSTITRRLRTRIISAG